jgi:flagellar hook-basal body complex protein FliE
LAGLAENHSLFGATWSNRRADLKDQSASGYDLALAGIGVSCELTDQQIADLVIHHRRDFPGKKQDRRGSKYLSYLKRAISRARQGRQSSESAQQQSEEFAEAIKNSAITVDGAQESTLSTAEEAEQPDPAVLSADVSSTQSGGVRPGCAEAVEFLVAKVRQTGNVAMVYDNIATLAALSEAQLAATYQNLRKVLGAELNGNHFNRAIKETRARLRCKTAQEQVQDPRPTILTNDRLLDEIAADAIAALESANQPAVLFRRGGRLVMIQPDEDDRPVIVQATGPMMRGRLARVARFLRETRQTLIRVSPPEDLTLDVLSANEGVFPPLGVVTQIPILRPDGTLRLEPGYDPITHAYYHTSPGFKLGTIADTPALADAVAAAQFLDEAIGEFPFATSADKANCIALMLTPILKVGFRMKSPLALIDAPKWGTGKSLLASVVYVLTTGSEGTVCAAPTSEEEWRKRVTSILERGSAVVIIDNVNQTLQSSSLSAVLTTSNWEDRVLGKSEDIRLPNVSTWIATGNNLVLGAEMARRGYQIRLDAKVSNPSRRSGFKRNDQELLDWVAAHRGELVAALLTTIRAWWVAGKPKADVQPFGSFSKWARMVGGILGYAAVKGFLENLDAVQQDSDEESRQWEQFLRALAIVFRGLAFTTAEIVEHAVHHRDVLSDAIPDEIANTDEGGNGGTSFQKKLGKALARKCGTRFGELELRLERCEPDKHTKVQRWRVGGDLDSLLSKEANESAGFHRDL